MKRVEPWMVAAALGLAGLIGAAGVWLLANAIRTNDRAAVREWDARAAPVLDRMWMLYQGLREAQAAALRGEGLPASERSSLRLTLDGARLDVERLSSVPPTLEPVVAEYQASIARMSDALAALNRLKEPEGSARAALEPALSLAERHLREGDARLKRLRARLER